LQTRTCSVCSEPESQAIAINSNAHDWGEWTIIKQPSFTEDGEETRTCLNNPTAHTDTHTIPKFRYLVEQLQLIKDNPESGRTYTLEVAEEVAMLAPQVLYFEGKSNITIILKGIGGQRTIRLASNGSLFNIQPGVTLVLDENITLAGQSDNTASLVQVFGALVMNDGAKITDNVATYPYPGGGVSVAMGTFTMNGGVISGNTASQAGGVSVSGGTFTMNGGEISDNTTTEFSGGGVCLDGTFTMNGGVISGNSNVGVLVREDAVFTMNGGVITGNTANYSGGGLCMSNGGTFDKTGGTITGYASDPVNGNVVRDIGSGNVVNNKGHAVFAAAYGKDGYDGGYIEKRKETTAGPEVNLSWDGTGSTVSFSGGWDY
jgi:hypothetical protein